MYDFCRRLKNKFTLTEELLLMALHISMGSTIKAQHSKQKPKPQQQQKNAPSSPTHFLTPTDISK